VTAVATPTRTDPPPKKVKPGKGLGMSAGKLGAILVSPTMIVLALVVAYPTIEALRQSLYGEPGLNEATGFISETEPFVGLDNYQAVFQGDTAGVFWNAFWNTSLFTVSTVLLETVLGVAMALIMHQAFKGRGLLRASILIPWAIPTALSGLLWGWIFNAEGVANALLPGQILWTSEGWASQLAVILADTWKTAPFVGLLVLAGLQVIPEEVYEAAKMDGASAMRRFWSITLPLVKPALLVAVLFRMLDALRMFELPLLLVGRKDSVETLSMLTQFEASNTRFGSAAAYAVLLFLFVFAVAFAFITLLGADLVGDSEKKQKQKLKIRRARRIKNEEAAA